MTTMTTTATRTMPLRGERGVYYVTTGIVALAMLGGGLGMLFSQANREAVASLGFPVWFATEVGLAKLASVVALTVPRVPMRIKEWAYAGVGIVLVSATLAHRAHGESVLRSCEPLGFLALLAVSNRALHRLRASRTV